MDDLEITKLCAEAMKLPEHGVVAGTVMYIEDDTWANYDPLHDDAQAMALVKKFCLNISWHYGKNVVRVNDGLSVKTQYRKDINQAICECVALMQKAKSSK